MRNNNNKIEIIMMMIIATAVAAALMALFYWFSQVFISKETKAEIIKKSEPTTVSFKYIDTSLIDKQENKIIDAETKEPIKMTWQELQAYVNQLNNYIQDKKIISVKSVTPENNLIKQLNDAMRADKTTADKAK